MDDIARHDPTSASNKKRNKHGNFGVAARELRLNFFHPHRQNLKVKTDPEKLSRQPEKRDIHVISHPATAQDVVDYYYDPNSEADRESRDAGIDNNCVS